MENNFRVCVEKAFGSFPIPSFSINSLWSLTQTRIQTTPSTLLASRCHLPAPPCLAQVELTITTIAESPRITPSCATWISPDCSEFWHWCQWFLFANATALIAHSKWILWHLLIAPCLHNTPAIAIAIYLQTRPLRHLHLHTFSTFKTITCTSNKLLITTFHPLIKQHSAKCSPPWLPRTSKHILHLIPSTINLHLANTTSIFLYTPSPPWCTTVSSQ